VTVAKTLFAICAW